MTKVRKRVLVVGLGRFGSAVAATLWEGGHEVVVVDESPEAVDAIKDRSSAAFVGDATQVKLLEGIGAADMDVAIVTFAERFEPAVLCVASLARMNVRQIVARAATERQAGILKAVGATRVVELEDEMGRRVGADITMPLAGDLVEFASHFRVVPWNAHGPLTGRKLADTGLRQQYRLNVLGVRRKGALEIGKKPKIEPAAPDYVVTDGDTLLLVGDADDLGRFIEEVGG